VTERIRRHVGRAEKRSRPAEERNDRRYGVRPQRPKRERERQARKDAVTYLRIAASGGISGREAAQTLGVAPQTLSSWKTAWSSGKRSCRPRGRPCRGLSAERRSAVMECLHDHWPHIHVRRLREIFPDVPTRALEDLLCRYGHFRRRKDAECMYYLIWHKPGRVWAIDYSKPPLPIDGIYRKLLNVRDLASGKILESLPVEEESAEHTAHLLERLFAQYGPPLVIKCDNGSTLIAEEIQRLRELYEVEVLLSPPQWPQYNGSCEAGNGSIKIRAHHIACAHGRVTVWSCDDIESACLQANELVVLTRYNGLSPDEVWDGKDPITKEERKDFRKDLQKEREDGLKELSDRLSEMANKKERTEAFAKAERDAVRRTLESSGLLTEKRRRIPLPKKR